jgi:arylsulfatase A-like enzyme
VPAYWPDNEVIRNDMLDYAFEVEHFDTHLGRMLAELEKRGLLENTLVVVTADHGMPFPRSKGNSNVQANHVPLAVMWKNGITAPGRVMEDFVSFIDLAPTLIEVAGIPWSETGMAESPGRSLMDLFANAPKHTRDHVLLDSCAGDDGQRAH